MKTFPALKPDHAASLREKARPFLEKSPMLVELRKRLLEYGGLEVVYQPEPHLTELLARGQVFTTHRLLRRPIEVCRCHGNSALIWHLSQGRTKIVRGYVLCDDGLWRQHSWGLENGRVIETTPVRRVRYVGFEMTHSEAVRFAFQNFPHDYLEQGIAAGVPKSWVREIVTLYQADVNSRRQTATK